MDTYRLCILLCGSFNCHRLLARCFDLSLDNPEGGTLREIEGLSGEGGEVVTCSVTLSAATSLHPQFGLGLERKDERCLLSTISCSTHRVHRDWTVNLEGHEKIHSLSKVNACDESCHLLIGTTLFHVYIWDYNSAIHLHKIKMSCGHSRNATPTCRHGISVTPTCVWSVLIEDKVLLLLSYKSVEVGVSQTSHTAHIETGTPSGWLLLVDLTTDGVQEQLCRVVTTLEDYSTLHTPSVCVGEHERVPLCWAHEGKLCVWNMTSPNTTHHWKTSLNGVSISAASCCRNAILAGTVGGTLWILPMEAQQLSTVDRPQTSTH
jgi:hypothetical protein